MTSTVFPYKGWVLSPSFKPVERTIVGPSYSPRWHTTESGKQYHISDIFPTKEAAIADGRIKIAAQMADVKKREANVLKRQAALDKAEGK